MPDQGFVALRDEFLVGRRGYRVAQGGGDLAGEFEQTPHRAKQAGALGLAGLHRGGAGGFAVVEIWPSTSSAAGTSLRK